MRAFATITLSTIGLLATAATASARPSCGDRVVNDWSDGRIDGVYALRCYSQAIDALPEDVRNYSTALDDISTALRARVRALGRKDARAALRAMAVRGAKRGGLHPPASAAPPSAGPEPGAPALSVPTLSGSTWSVPLPLVTLGAIAVLLGLAGSTGALAKRFRQRRC
jgi:hypothetical protein